MKKTRPKAKKRLKVAVLCGGPSSEWEVSMRSGKEIMKHLPPERYDASLIQITPDGRWMIIGRKEARPLSLFGKDGRIAKSDLRKFDLAFIALHGAFGEDGKVQALLETIGVPYTGSGILASALGMHKLKSQEVVSALGIRTPATLLAGPNMAEDPIAFEAAVRKEIGYPCVIKPNEAGSSVGVSIVKDPASLIPAFKRALHEGTDVLVQEYLKGRELTCGILGNSGSDLMPLPPVEIISPHEFFDYDAKYNSKGGAKEICPAPLPARLVESIQRAAALVHEALACDGLTRSDFILVKNKLYFLEINTIPGMTAASLCPKEAEAMGMGMGDFLSKIAEVALEKRRQ